MAIAGELMPVAPLATPLLELMKLADSGPPEPQELLMLTLPVLGSNDTPASKPKNCGDK